jgi:hypothetical protein
MNRVALFRYVVMALAVMLSWLMVDTQNASAQLDVENSISLQVFNCPPGMYADTLVGDDCTLATEGFEIAIVSLSGLMTPLTLTDASFDGSTFIWGNEIIDARGAFGPLAVHQPTLPSGYDSFVVTGAGVEFNEFGDYVIRILADSPTASVTIYNFAPAPSGNDDGTFDMPIFKINCTVSRDQFPQVPIFLAPTDVCDPGPGIVFVVTDADTGELIGSCESVIADLPDPVFAYCIVPVPYSSTVIVTEDISTAPAGYLPDQNDIFLVIPDGPPTGEWGGAYFINFLQTEEPAVEEPTGEEPDVEIPTIQLPNTGAGTTANSAESTGQLALIAALLGATAFSYRRRMRRA